MVEAAAKAVSTLIVVEVAVVATARAPSLTETAARPMTMTNEFNKKALDWLRPRGQCSFSQIGYTTPLKPENTRKHTEHMQQSEATNSERVPTGSNT